MAAATGKQFELTDNEFMAIHEMIYNAIGVNLTESKRALTVSRLSRRVRELQLNSIGDYLKHVKHNPGELDMMFNLLTTNVTKFFREVHHYDYLVDVYLPRLEEMAAAGLVPRRLRCWSAGCSTGEEPYTLALVLHRYFKGRKGWKIQILASDINTETLRKAEEGVYSRAEVADIPYEQLKTYFKLGTGSNTGLFRVKDVLRDMIDFRRINLTAAGDYPISSPLNFIFCRNVFIYFDKQTQKQVLMHYHRNIMAGGLLFLGHSESINTVSADAGMWRLIKHTIYEKLN